MKKLLVILGISTVVLVGGVAMFGNQQVKVSSQAELLAEASPPSPPTSQRNPPVYNGAGGPEGGGSGGGGTKPGPRTIQPKIPKG